MEQEPESESVRAGRKKIHCKKTQRSEEGRRVLSESGEENPGEEDPLPARQFCICSVSTVAGLPTTTMW
jgi:hypothetical protein